MARQRFTLTPFYLAKKRALSQAGTSLAELTVVLAIIGIAVIATGSLMQHLAEVQSETVTDFELSTTKAALQHCARDARTWSYTVAKAGPVNPELQCLWPSSVQGCRSFDGQTFPLQLFSGLNPNDSVNLLPTGNPNLPPPPWCRGVDTTAANAGFDYKGQPCTGFDVFNGNPQCPFQYKMTWSPRCSARSGDPECRRVDVTITAQLQYKPGPDAPPKTPRNIDALGFELKKNVNAAQTFSMRVWDRRPLEPVTLLAPPGGRCVPGQWTPRRLTEVVFDTSRTVDFDRTNPANIIENVTGSIRLNPPTTYTLGGSSVVGSSFTLAAGRYRCRVLAPAYKVKSHRARLVKLAPNGSPVLPAFEGTNGDADYGVVTNGPNQVQQGGDAISLSEVLASFDLAQPTTFQVQHYCEQSTCNAGTSSDSCLDFGFGSKVFICYSKQLQILCPNPNLAVRNACIAAIRANTAQNDQILNNCKAGGDSPLESAVYTTVDCFKSM